MEISIPFSSACAAADRAPTALINTERASQCYLSFHKAGLNQGQSMLRNRGREMEGEKVQDETEEGIGR